MFVSRSLTDTSRAMNTIIPGYRAGFLKSMVWCRYLHMSGILVLVNPIPAEYNDTIRTLPGNPAKFPSGTGTRNTDIFFGLKNLHEFFCGRKICAGPGDLAF